AYGYSVPDPHNYECDVNAAKSKPFRKLKPERETKKGTSKGTFCIPDMKYSLRVHSRKHLNRLSKEEIFKTKLKKQPFNHK
ncbi:hypothetical protein, partial [Escherichia coli]|uniref:hypothetical protein n=1 Tax=Escherichia coli TaxID=562 RepID=UPI001BFC86D8